MTLWDNYFYRPVAAIRPYLFQKCLLLVVATDALVLMSERGSRYGIDGFNVAHFRWLDAIHPLPGATWYVGILMLVSVLGYTLCFAGPSRVLMAALALLYTYGWAMSRHDSYMHHYMLSLIFFAMVFFPRISYASLLPIYTSGPESPRHTDPARQAGPQRQSAASALRWGTWFVFTTLGIGVVYRTFDVLAASWAAFFAFFLIVGGWVIVYVRKARIAAGPLTTAWAYRLLGVTVGVIYIYTSVAKADAEWCGGYTLQSVGATKEVLAPFVEIAGSFGISPDWFWAILATIVIPVELTIACSYFLAVLQDEPGRKWIPRWCIAAWLLAIGLHLNNEMVNLSIQWFGYYMMFLATFFFLPQRALLALGACMVLPAHWWHSYVIAPLAESSRQNRLVILAPVTACAGATLVVVSRFIALPGALWALPVAAAVVVVYSAASLLKPSRFHARDSIAKASAVGLAGLVMGGFVSQSSMRHDYYWNLGVELQNLDGLGPQTQQMALLAYEQAEAFGPPQKGRHIDLLINMGLAHRRLGDLRGAVAQYEKALGVDPTSVLAHYNMGFAYQVAGNYKRAADNYRRAIALAPTYMDAYHQLAQTLELSGDLSGALECLRAAQRLRQNDLEIQQAIARLLGKMRNAVRSSQHATSY